MKIKLFTDTAKIPHRGSQYAAGYDLCADIQSTLSIPAGRNKTISTGVGVELPKNYFGAIFARSGLSTNEGLRPANCVGKHQ